MRFPRSPGAAVGLILVAIEALYLIGANSFLHSRSFDSLVNGNPDNISVRTRAAFSPFPGWVVAGQIQVRGQDDEVQWLVTVQDARVWVSLTDLLFHREFHVRRLDAKSGGFQFRTRSLPDGYRAEDVAELPPIAGFDPDTLLKSRSDSAKRASDLLARTEPGRLSGLRQVRIEHVHIQGFNEIWVGAYRFDGEIDVSGSFTLNLGHRLEIPAGRLEVHSGSLVRQGRSIAQNLNGSIDADIRDYELEREHGLDIFKTLSAKLSLRGRLDSFDPFAFMLRNQDWFRLQSTEGTFSVDATARDGRLVAVQTASLAAERLLASFSHFVIQGAAKVGFEIDHSGSGRFEFNLPTCQILTEKDHAPILDGRGLRIVVESPDLELDHLYRRVVARVTLPNANIASFEFLNRWIPPSSGISVQDGTGRISAELAVSNYLQTQTPPGRVSITAERLRIKKGPDRIVGNVAALVRAEQVYHESTGMKELKISGTELHVTGSLANAAKTWTTDMNVVQGSVWPDDNPAIRASVELHVPDVSPFLSEFGIQSGLGKFAQNLLVSGNFEGTTDLTLGDRRIDLDQMKLASDSAWMRGLLHLRGDGKQALALVHYGVLSVGIQLDKGETHVHLAGAEDWYKKASAIYGQPGAFLQRAPEAPR